MRRETQNVLLVLLGGAIIKVCWTGDVTRYVKPSLVPWLVASGVITIALAIIGIVRDIVSASHDGAHAPDGPHDHGDHAGDDHAHGVASHSPWLLILPALAIFLVAPPALGADKVERSAPAVVAAPPEAQSDGIGFAPIPAEDAPVLSLSDAVTRAVWDDSGTLDDREIRLVGFAVPSADGASVYLARLAIGCCAADATPVKVTLAGVDPGTYVRDTWLEVRGTMVPDSASEATQWVPAFAVTAVAEIPAPDDPYEV